jgi:hypothetical protein
LKIALDGRMQVKSIVDKQIDVLGENKEHMVIDDDLFTRLDKQKAKRGRYQYSQYIGEIKISDYTKDSYFRESWGHLIISVYHFGMSKKILQNRVNKAVNFYINSKIGQYISLGKCNITL